MGGLRMLIESRNSFFPYTDDEALAWLDSHCYAHRERIRKAMPYDLHHIYGQEIRNTLGLWQEPKTHPLVIFFKKKHGLDHPDDISNTLLMRYAEWLSKGPHLPPWHDDYKPPTMED